MSFERLAQILLPHGGLVAMMEAYFDESGTHDGSPVMCVAGYLFEADQAVHFDREWKAVLEEYGVSYFHMSSCANGAKHFAKIEKSKRAELATRLIGIIKRRIRIGIVVSVSPDEWKSIVPDSFDSSTYTLCLQQCLNGIGSWATRYGFEGKIAYFFEAGHKQQKRANEAMNDLQYLPAVKDYVRYGSHTFADKRDVRGLQAADILAWLWGKHIRNNSAIPKRPMRLDYRNLIASPHIHSHFDIPAIQHSTRSALAGTYEPYAPKEMLAARNSRWGIKS